MLKYTDEKVTKQVAVNIGIAMISILLLFFIKCLTWGQIIAMEELLGAEFIFVLISALMTTIGWRFAEGIEGQWVYNILLAAEVVFLLVEYGYALSEASLSEVFSVFMRVTTVVFVVFYALENIIIYKYFIVINRSVATVERTNYSYKEREGL